MKAKSILSALLHIRAEIIRDDLDGLTYVDALLLARGFDPAKQTVQKKIPRYFPGRGKRRQSILSALRQGPGTSLEIAERVAKMHPGLGDVVILGSISVGLTMLKQVGLVKHEGQVWGLRPPAANSLSSSG